MRRLGAELRCVMVAAVKCRRKGAQTVVYSQCHCARAPASRTAAALNSSSSIGSCGHKSRVYRRVYG